MAGRHPAPPVFSADGCHVELRVAWEQPKRVGAGVSGGSKDFLANVDSRFLVTAKGTHDTDPERLTGILRRALTRALGSEPIAMPPAFASGLIELTWEGNTWVKEEALLAILSEAISTTKVRKEWRIPREAYQPALRGGKIKCPPGFFQTTNHYDGKAVWRCISCGADFETEEAVKRHQS